MTSFVTGDAAALSSKSLEVRSSSSRARIRRVQPVDDGIDSAIDLAIGVIEGRQDELRGSANSPCGHTQDHCDVVDHHEGVVRADCYGGVAVVGLQAHYAILTGVGDGHAAR